MRDVHFSSKGSNMIVQLPECLELLQINAVPPGENSQDFVKPQMGLPLRKVSYCQQDTFKTRIQKVRRGPPLMKSFPLLCMTTILGNAHY